MLKHVFINGIDGNMGKRYAAILKMLDIEVSGADKNHLDLAGLKAADGFILATPTHMHLADLRRFVRHGKPILCEKPFTKEEEEFDYFVDEHAKNAGQISMVNQYQWLFDPNSKGKSYYDYYKTGGDGLHWDTINLTGLSDEFPSIKNGSPIWRAAINGHQLSIGDMDFAYVKMIKAWVTYPDQTNWNYMVLAHRKIFDFLGGKID